MMAIRQVKDWMTPNVITVPGSCPLPEAHRHMIGHLRLAVDPGRPLTRQPNEHAQDYDLRQGEN